MRSDIKRIKSQVDSYLELIDSGVADRNLEEENSLLRELLTSYMAITESEYLSSERLQLNILCRMVLELE